MDPAQQQKLNLAKRELRRQVLALREAMSPRERAEASAAVVARVQGLPAFRAARGVHLFHSLMGEVDTAPLFDGCARNGVATLVPIQQPESGTLGWSLWAPGDALVPGPFGVMEPPPESRRQGPLAMVDVVLVPGVAFDRRGNRVGYGKGYYDTFLPELARARNSAGKPPTLRVALCFACQVVEQVPAGPWDQSVDWIINEKEVIAVKEGIQG